MERFRKSKKGMASFYVVIFATILFGVVTVSFMRIILSESNQSSNDDLSRSAYDSAIAGVEDAKTAVNRYYSCLNGTGRAGDCDLAKYATLFSENCDDGIGIAKYLYGDSYHGNKDDETEVKIQENKPNGSDPNNASDQAYTCVIVSDTVPDYRGTLTSDTPTKAIPLGVYNSASGTTSTQISDVKKIKFSWYSRLNEGDIVNNAFKLNDDKSLSDKNNATIPPTVALTFIKVKKDMDINQFHNLNNTDNLVYSTVVLVPSTSSGINNQISYDQLKRSGNVDTPNTKNEPFQITCSTTSEFACSVDFTNVSFASDDSVFLIVSLPYNDTTVDFAATLYNQKGESLPFVGVQVKVDSTGRTNQLFRRVEARLDPTDLFFPYPQYELFLDGEGDDTLNKSFWITANCWHTHPLDGDDTSTKPKICPNNAELGD